MHRLTVSAAASALALALSCGKPPEKPPLTPDDATPLAGDDEKPKGEATVKAGAGAEKEPKKDECLGFDVENLEELLMKSACEEAAVKPDGVKPVDLKGKLEVTLTASPTKVAPGGKADLLVSFTNKTAAPMTLHFRLDPVPRFEVETYAVKNKARLDLPKGNPPPPPKGQSQPPPSEPKTARVVLAANGSARARVPWEAVKMKWAPDKVRGTPPEKGFPRVPAGPLAAGKVTVKVVTPLVGVTDGESKELTAPKVDIEIGG